MAGSSRKTRGNGDKRAGKKPVVEEQVEEEQVQEEEEEEDTELVDDVREEEEEAAAQDGPGMDPRYMGVDPTTGLQILHPRGLW